MSWSRIARDVALVISKVLFDGLVIVNPAPTLISTIVIEPLLATMIIATPQREACVLVKINRCLDPLGNVMDVVSFVKVGDVVISVAFVSNSACKALIKPPVATCERLVLLSVSPDEIAEVAT